MVPLFERRPDLERAGVIRVWLFDDSATMVDQCLGPSMNDEVVSFITGEVEAELQRRWISKGRAVRYLHDWRSITTYEAHGRERLIEWGKVSKAHTAEAAICLSRSASAFIRIAAVTGVAVLRMLRIPISVVDDLEPLLAPLRSRRAG
ncbi:MAG: hypothetical protein JNJ54_10850 [Myxococcaceae bacterium]|nr:hypothetical protein [Myxococcaceae bacterium]